MSLLAGIGAVLGGLGGLFGGTKKSPTPYRNMIDQAAGARQAAYQYGFNPLTMLQYGQPGGAIGGGGGAPPLASVQMLVDGIAGIDDELSGDADRRRAAEQLNLELAQIRLDQARSGVVAVAPSATATVGAGLPPLGRRAAMVVPQIGAQPVTRGMADQGTPNAGDHHNREVVSDHLVARPPLGDVPVPDSRLDRGTSAFVGGRLWESTPGWSPANIIEDEYAEIGSNLYAPFKLVRDAVHNFGRFSTWVEAQALKSKGSPVFKMGGKYYAPLPRPPKIESERLPPGHRLDLRRWPLDGFDPRSPNYIKKD